MRCRCHGVVGALLGSDGADHSGEAEPDQHQRHRDLRAGLRGHGRRASLYSDYTFAVWQDDKLVPIAKAYSGLTDEEMKLVDDYVRKNTLEKFGPVRTVKPGLVFEIAFEGIQNSPRPKSGIAVRFPRIARRRPDKPIEEADTLTKLRDMLELYGKENTKKVALRHSAFTLTHVIFTRCLR